MTSLTLEHRRQIDRAKEILVPAAEQVLEDGGVGQMGKNDFGHSQLRNLIAVALETDSPAVVENFIRYQMGRDPHGNGWAKVAGGKKLGERFLDELAASGAVGQALAGLGIAGDRTAEQLARSELIRHFLGFAARYLKFLDLQPSRSRGGRGDRP